MPSSWIHLGVRTSIVFLPSIKQPEGLKLTLSCSRPGIGFLRRFEATSSQNYVTLMMQLSSSQKFTSKGSIVESGLDLRDLIRIRLPLLSSEFKWPITFSTTWTTRPIKPSTPKDTQKTQNQKTTNENQNKSPLSPGSLLE